MARNNRAIYTRVYSSTSAGQLTSGKGATGPRLTKSALLAEFERHADRRSETSTALVSVSSRIVDTVHRAFQKYQHEEDGEDPGEDPADIWIVFIEVPPGQSHPHTVLPHSARDLAQQCSDLDPNPFRYKFVFEWRIPDEYVLHKVSLKTLLDRGFEIDLKAQSTRALRASRAEEFRGSSSCPFELGFILGCMARPFGFRAPTEWIAYQLFDDCVRTWGDCDAQTVDLGYAHKKDADMTGVDYADERTGSQMVEFDFFCDLHEGIGTAVEDWWVPYRNFASEYEEFEAWRRIRVDAMAWEAINFWKAGMAMDLPAGFLWRLGYCGMRLG